MSKPNEQLPSKADVVMRRKANRSFTEALKKARAIQESFLDLAGILADLRADGLWKHITDARGRRRFHQFPEVVEAILGSKARKTIYDHLAADSLTQDKTNPIPAAEVNRMGISRVAQVARLEPTDRTPEIRKAAVTKTVLEVRNQVQQKLNAKLPPTEQKPMLKLLAINLPEDVVKEFEELMEVMSNTDGARDGDNSQTIRAKAFKLILIGAEEYWAQELAEAMKRMKAEACVDDSPAVDAQEEDSPYEGNEIDTEADADANKEVATQPHSKHSDDTSRLRQLMLLT